MSGASWLDIRLGNRFRYFWADKALNLQVNGSVYAIEKVIKMALSEAAPGFRSSVLPR